jgi:hypothetical protein
MGHSYVELSGRYKWMRDSDVIIAAHLVCDVAKDGDVKKKLTPGVAELLYHWNGMYDVYRVGCIDPDLNAYVKTEADKDCLIGLLEETKNLACRQNAVKKEYLNQITNAPFMIEFLHDEPSKEIQRIFDEFIKLIKGDLP